MVTPRKANPQKPGRKPGMVPLETRPDWKLLLYVHFFLMGGKSAPNIFVRLALRELHIQPLSLETERAWLIANTHDETLERGSDAEITERESRQAPLREANGRPPSASTKATGLWPISKRIRRNRLGSSPRSPRFLYTIKKSAIGPKA